MAEQEIGWWMLQVQFQEKYPDQLNWLSSPISRDELLRQCIKLIPPSNIKVNIKSKVWGLADLDTDSNDEYYAELTVKPPVMRIAEEKSPGILDDKIDPRIFTPVIINIELQLIFIQKTPDILRFARTAYSFADVFGLLIMEAMRHLDMSQHYELFVEPIAQKGSFSEWYSNLEKLNKLTVHYVGPNLPSRPDSLIETLKNNAKSFRDTLKSSSVDLTANEPKLSYADVLELDTATSERKLKLKARGIKLSYPTKWSSKDKLEAETLYLNIEERELSNPKKLVTLIRNYIKNRFFR